jgi:hypothetical protein
VHRSVGITSGIRDKHVDELNILMGSRRIDKRGRYGYGWPSIVDREARGSHDGVGIEVARSAEARVELPITFSAPSQSV